MGGGAGKGGGCLSLETALRTQLASESVDSPAEQSRAEPRYSSPHLPTSIASTWGRRLLLSSHRVRLILGGDQALAEAAGRPAARTVPAPYRAGWDGYT